VSRGGVVCRGAKSTDDCFEGVDRRRDPGVPFMIGADCVLGRWDRLGQGDLAWTKFLGFTGFVLGTAENVGMGVSGSCQVPSPAKKLRSARRH